MMKIDVCGEGKAEWLQWFSAWVLFWEGGIFWGSGQSSTSKADSGGASLGRDVGTFSWRPT
jgi:hypothetical protein